MKGGYYTHDRREAFDSIDKNCVFYCEKPLGRRDTWKQMATFAFCISPHGHGLDCHRTWEALALGCVPIVKSSPLDPLYSKFPIWIVQDWSHVTQDSIKAKFEEMQSRMAQWSVEDSLLNLSHWTRFE
jgi:hypothetical protein